jgi:hypothetical protein
VSRRLRASALLAFALPAAAAAQGVRERAFAWAQGDFRAPLVCVIGGASRQALRRVRIVPAPASALPSLRVALYDLEAPPGTSCAGVSSPQEPNVIGTLELVHEGRNRPDTGEVDFRNALKRDGGFEFRIRSGRLRIGAAADPSDTLASPAYAGGRAFLRTVAPGSDEARRLAAFGALRAFRLELEAEGAPSLGFDLVELPSR